MKIEHKRFIDAVVKSGGDHIGAYMEVFNITNRRSAGASSNRLLKNAAIAAAIKDQLQKITDAATKEVTQELQKEISSRFLSLADKRRILAEIAKAEVWVEVPYIKKNGKQGMMKRRPTPKERSECLRLDAQLMGEMASDKREPPPPPPNPNEPVVPSKLSVDELLKIAKAFNG